MRIGFHDNFCTNYVINNQSSIAPGDYITETVNLDKAPQYSFGIKHTLDKPNDSPGK